MSHTLQGASPGALWADIHYQVALAPGDALESIIAARTRNMAAFDALRVHAASRWVLVPPALATHLSTQGVMYALKCAVVLPSAKVAINALPVRVRARQLPPGATGCQQVEHGVGGLTQTQSARASHRFWRRQHVLD